MKAGGSQALCRLAALLASLWAAGPALAYEENSFANSADLFFARVGEPTTLALPTSAQATALMAACKSGRSLLVESGPLACKCTAERSEQTGQRRPTELAVTLRCPARKGTPEPGALVLVSDPALTFTEQRLDDVAPLADSAAQPILQFLMSVDADLRKRKRGPWPVYPLAVAGQPHWIVQTETKTLEEAGCDKHRFQIVKRRGEAFERVGNVDDIDAIVRLKPDGAVLLRTSNQCDGIQSALHELAPKMERRADFSGH